MSSNSNTYSYHLATNPGYGPAADMNVLDWQGSGLAAEQIQTFADPNDVSGSGTYGPAQIPWGTHPSSSTFHQHQLLPHENTGGLITGGYSDGSSGNAGPTTLGASGGTDDDGWPLTLHWKRADNAQAQAQVQATDPVYNPMPWMWPPDLHLMFGGDGLRTIDIQSWVRNKRAPTTRIKCVHSEDNPDFGKLVKLLRNCGGYATAGWDVEGTYQPRLLFAPLYMDVLCVAFPNGIPELPTRHSGSRRGAKSSKRSSEPAPLPNSVAMPPSLEQAYLDAMDDTQNPQPQQWMQPQADSPPPEPMESQQSDPNLLVPCNQVTMVTPPHLQLGPQAGPLPLQPSQTQQCLEVASQDMVIADNDLDDWRTETDTPTLVPDAPMSTGSASPIRGDEKVWFGVGENDANYAHTEYIFGGANPIGSFANLNLGGGEDQVMNGAMMDVPHNLTADPREQRWFDEHMFGDEESGNWI